jgi:hypothetical protein
VLSYLTLGDLGNQVRYLGGGLRIWETHLHVKQPGRTLSLQARFLSSQSGLRFKAARLHSSRRPATVFLLPRIGPHPEHSGTEENRQLN